MCLYFFINWTRDAVRICKIYAASISKRVIVSQGRKPRSVEDVDRMDVVPDSPSSCNEQLPESLQV